MLKERTWTRVWLAGLLLVAVLSHVQAEGVSSVTINEIILSVQERTFTVCYNDTVDGVTVAGGSIINKDPQVNLEDTTGLNPCPNFKIPSDVSFDPGETIKFELRLYSDNTDTTEVARGYIEFDNPDLPVCTTAYIVPNSDEWTLVGMACNKNFTTEDNIVLDPKTVILEKSSNGDKTYILLDQQVTGDVVLKVTREIEAKLQEEATDTSTVTITYDELTIDHPAVQAPDVSSLSLAYEPMEILITTSSTGSIYDVVYWWDDNNVETPTYTLNTCLNSTYDGTSVSCGLQGYSQGSNTVTAALAIYDSNDITKITESGFRTIQDYNIEGRFITTKTLEWNWNKGSESDFQATLTETTSNTVTVTSVICEGNEPLCYVYFLQLDKNKQYTVTIQPKSGSGDYDPLNKIISKTVPSTPSQPMEVFDSILLVEEVELDWRRDGVRVDVGVCFHYRDVTVDDTGLTQYQLVLVDAEGRWRGVHGASHTREGRLCFSRVTLDSRQFNTAEEVTVLVIKRDVDGRTVLASGESHVFFISPAVEVMSAYVGRVSWGNPGGYTIASTIMEEGHATTKREGNETHLTATTTERLLHYFVRKRTENKLVVEANTGDIKMTAVVPLTRSEAAAAGM